ncbi:MAG: prolyl oligopeptidase family serine peptidase, partial [Verrucomicrobiae bacterium]|nr:prolyl oligopeptidase family serine peptidase [Verrucomicrobiae bacterium]
DYLQSRPEVNPERIGVTGRSGGGAYSWWVAALDERIKVAAPVAGITDLENHVVDGCVEGHCDCMFMVNTYRWDYAQVAALVAPRPLLICNSDKDKIFPLDGVQRIHEKVREVYHLYRATTNLGLLITEGPHKDTQDLQVPVFRWFNRHLKGEEPLITVAAEKLLPPAQLKVLDAPPKDQRTTTIHESFVPVAKPMVLPESREALDAARERIVEQLRAKSFHGWPATPGVVAMENVGRHKLGATQFLVGEFNTDESVRLRLYAFAPDVEKLRRVVVMLVDNVAFPAFAATVEDAVPGAMADEVALMKRLQLSPPPGLDATLREETKALLADGETAVLFFAPRGLGMDTWNPPAKYAMDLPRRFQLLGQTVEAMRVWDILALTGAIRSVEAAQDADIEIRASGALAVNARTPR